MVFFLQQWDWVAESLYNIDAVFGHSTEGVESINKKLLFRVVIGALRKESVMTKTLTVSVLFGLIKIRTTKTKKSA